MCQQATAEFPQLEKLLTRQLVVVIAAIVIATPVSAASGAAGDTCVRHRRQRSANSSLRGTDAEHHSILSGTEQHHQASQYHRDRNAAQFYRCGPGIAASE